MTTIRLYMTVSLDGYVAGPRDSVDDPMGVGGFRLFNWLDLRNEPGPSGEVYAEVLATRALISGRRTYEHADRWHGDHHDGVPVFILSRTKTPADVEQWPLITVLDDAADAITRAKEAAGDRDVLVHGVGCAAAALSAGVLDEVQLHLVPTILGEGRRLFEGIGAEPHEFELLRNIEGPGVTHLRYRVVR